MTVQSAPVAEPPRAPVRPVAPGKENGHARPSRSVRPGGERNKSPRPSVPPARHAPPRLTPLLFFFAQTLLDVVAVATAYGLAYRLRFDLDILRKFVAPDEPTY